MVTSAGAKKYYLKYSEANAKSGKTDYVTLSWKSDFSGNDCLNETAVRATSSVGKPIRLGE